MKTEFEKKLSRNINKIKKAIKELEAEGLRLYVDKGRETLFGKLVDNIYVRDVSPKGKIYLQKHLLSIYSI
jgi:G:T-mismatch repair DNA endonuclease (very short patch repair protein)